MSPAAKVDMLIQLYQAGLLCSCNRTEKVYNEFTGEYQDDLMHEAECTGRYKIQELLGQKDDNEQI